MFFIFGGKSVLANIPESRTLLGAFFKGLYISIVETFITDSLSYLLTAAGGTFICLLYIERKIGSVNTLLLVLSFMLLFALPSGSLETGNGYGSPFILSYGLLGYMLCDMLLSLRKSVRNKQNSLFGLILLVPLYVVHSFSLISEGIVFTLYPYMIFSGYATSLIILGVIINLITTLSVSQGQNIHFN